MINSELVIKIEKLLDEKGKESLSDICELLQQNIQHYNWVGFYFMNNESRILEIGPYAGAETEHTRIPYGKGICGQVAESGETFIVQDVTAQDNYIACSIETKSEIVLPIYKGDQLIAQLDIDSHYASPFTEDDQDLLKKICDRVGKVL